jgi:hypothetical protein
MRRITLMSTAIFGLTAAPLAAEIPVSLRGSPASMVRQNSVARDLDYVFARTPDQLRELEASGQLVRLEGSPDYEIADFVSWQVARPELRLFIERLAQQYHEATGEKLVVTSLTRPASDQPGNSHALSVHPTGMAVDLRVSQRAASREWLESALLGLEGAGVLDITREYNPPHYHIALFPVEYMAYVEPRLEAEAALAAEEAAEARRVAEAMSAAAEGSSSALLSSTTVSGQGPRLASVWPIGLGLLIAAGFGMARRLQRS